MTEAASQLSTAAVAAAVGYSVQQVRDLEAYGVIAPAVRSGNGYRQFGATQVRDLRAYRDLAGAAGPVEARRVMREIRVATASRAAAMVGELQVGLHREREQALAALRALESVRTEALTEADPVEGDSMTITELSRALGVRASTLRFWEKAGLVTPERIPTAAGTARRYPLAAIREARIVAALRAGGYRIPDVRRAITALRDLDEVSGTVDALEARLESIAERTLALLRAGAVLVEIIEAGRD